MYDMKALYEAKNVSHAIQLLREHPGAQIIAGGSDVLVQMAEAFRTGIMPEITVITAQTQKGTNKVERVAYSDITVDEFMLAKFEKKAKTEQEVPFKFGNFEVLETL